MGQKEERNFMLIRSNSYYWCLHCRRASRCSGVICPFCGAYQWDLFAWENVKNSDNGKSKGYPEIPIVGDCYDIY